MKKEPEAYERKFDASPKVNENLKCNLLLIRESFKAFQKVPPYSTNISMEIFYKALGLYVYEEPMNATIKEIKNAQNKAIREASDIYAKFLDDMFSNKYFSSIQKGLMDAGLPERFIRKNRTARILVNTEFDALIYNCLTRNIEVKSKEIKLKLMEYYLQKNKEVCDLVMVIYKLINLILPNETQNLHTANEVIEKILENDLPKEVKNSSTYAKYLKNLADSVVSVEKEFPNFYALTQQMKQKKSAQSIMNETTKILEQLKGDIEISKADAESTSCQNMMNEIAKVMLKIQQSLTL